MTLIKPLAQINTNSLHSSHHFGNPSYHAITITTTAIFNWVSKAIQDYFGFALLRYVIGPENWCHFLSQSDFKPKPITTWSPAFSRALGCLIVFTLSSHWLWRVFSFLLIGCWFWIYDTQLKSALRIILTDTI